MAEIGDRGPLRAPREIAKLEEDQHQHLRGRDGGDGEIRPAQPEAQPADRQAGEHDPPDWLADVEKTSRRLDRAHNRTAAECREGISRAKTQRVIATGSR